MYQGLQIERAVWSTADALQQTQCLKKRAEVLNAVLSEFGVQVHAHSLTKTKQIKVFGFYYPLSDECHVELSNETLQGPLLIGKRLTQLLFEVNCTVQHELIHKYQWVHRDRYLHRSNRFRGNNDQRYLASYDEIETQSHDAAMEIKFYYPDKDPRDILRWYFTKRTVNIPSLNNYMKAFDGNASHPAMRRLLSKTYGWLDHVSVLRPITYNKGLTCQS